MLRRTAFTFLLISIYFCFLRSNAIYFREEDLKIICHRFLSSKHDVISSADSDKQQLHPNHRDGLEGDEVDNQTTNIRESSPIIPIKRSISSESESRIVCTRKNDKTCHLQEPHRERRLNAPEDARKFSHFVRIGRAG